MLITRFSVTSWSAEGNRGISWAMVQEEMGTLCFLEASGPIGDTGVWMGIWGRGEKERQGEKERLGPRPLSAWSAGDRWTDVPAPPRPAFLRSCPAGLEQLRAERPRGHERVRRTRLV